MKKIIFIIFCIFQFLNIYADTYTTEFIQGDAGTVTATKLNDNNYQWEFEATPAQNYQFLYWIDINKHKFYDNPIQITIDSASINFAIQATFLSSIVSFNSYIDNWIDTSMIIKSVDTYLSDFNNGIVELYVDEEKITESSNSTKVLDNGVWEIDATNLLSNNSNAGKSLQVITYNECDEITSIMDTIVPYIVSSSCSTSNITIPNNADIYVLENTTLTINSNVTTSGTLVIHPNAKVIVDKGDTINAKTVIMHGNGITEKWPNLVVNGTINADTINYDYTIDYKAYYPLALPHEVKGSDIYNPINHQAPSYYVGRYNTETRYTGASGWEEFNYETFKHGRGFITYAVPMRWNGLMQSEAIVRFPMKYNDGVEKSNKTHTYLFSTTDNSYEIYDKNWNLIGNPYLTEFAINKTDTLGTSNLKNVEIQEGFYYMDEETGNFILDTETYPTVRYITYSTDGFRTYQQKQLKGFIMKPFNSYFIQTVKGTNLIFSKNDRAQNAPRRIQSLFEDTKDIEVGIKIEQNNIEDNIGFVFGNDYTEEYELNADLVKEFGDNSRLALYSLQVSNNHALAFQALPNNYLNYPIEIGFSNNKNDIITFKLDESYEIDDNIEIWLTDNKLNNHINLLYENYEFMPSDNDNNRFYITVNKKSNNDTTTNIDNVSEETNIKVYNILGLEIENTNQLNPNQIYIIKNNNQCRKELYR